MWTIPTEVKLALFQGMLVCAGGPRLSCYDGRFRRVIGDDEAFRTSDALLALCRQGVNLEAFLLRGSEPVLCRPFPLRTCRGAGRPAGENQERLQAGKIPYDLSETRGF